MKKLMLFSILLMAFFQQAVAQETIAKLKYEEAEEAYTQGNYELTVNKLREIEQMLKSTNPKILYLQLMAQSKIIEKNPYSNYAMIESARKGSAKYLKDYEKIPNNEDRYRDIYKVSEFLKKYPENKEAFDAELKKQEQEKIERKKQEEAERLAEAKRIQEEKEKQLKEQEQARIKRLRNVGFGAFRIGYAMPLSATSKEVMSAQQWKTGITDPIASPLQYGEFGLKRGLMLGFTGIAALHRLNAILPSKIGVGISMDFNQAFYFYNWKDLAFGNADQEYLFNDASYRPFGITSWGIGPSFTYHPMESRRLFIDAFARMGLNMIWGGKYEVDTYAKDETNITVTASREKMTFKFGPCFGLNLRYGSLFTGFDFRLGLIDQALYNESITMSNYSYYQSSYYSDTRSFATSGRNFNSFNISLGVNF